MNILICDEMESDANKLTYILDYSYGNAVKTAVFHSASDALSYIGSGAAVDVCFLETAMREMSGIELAKKMRAGGYEGEIVFLSRTNGFAAETYEVKALDYLIKPPIPDDVRDVLRKLEDKLRKNGADCGAAAPEADPYSGNFCVKEKRKTGRFIKRLFDR